MNELTSDERKKHIDFMKDPSQWPLFPLLPVKQRKEGLDFPRLGVIFSTGGPEVILETIYEVAKLIELPNPDKGKWMIYESWDELVDDGWVVD